MGFVYTFATRPIFTFQVSQNIPRQPLLFYWKYVMIALIPKECN